MPAVPFQPALLLCSALLAVPAAAQRGRESAPPELEHLVFQERSFASEAVGGESRYGVFLPKDYDAEENRERRYPLVVWLHGMNEDHRRFLTRGGGEVLDRMVGTGAMPACVFVCANGDRSSFWTNGQAENHRYEDLVTQDLLAHLEQTYRIAEEREQRAIAGVSMGGYGALKIALKNPGRFGAVVAHSAAILPEDPEKLTEEFPWLEGRGGRLLAAIFGDPLDVAKWRAENVLVLAREVEKDDLQGLRIYFDCGTEDRYGFDRSNQQFHELLEAHDVPHTFELVEDGGHGWRSGYNQAAVPNSLAFLAASFGAASGRKALGGLLQGGGDEGKSGRDR